MASGSTAPFSGDFVDLENVPKLPEGISAEQILEQNSDVVRQVAEARFNAGLSQVNADGGFFDAFVDQSKTSNIAGCELKDLKSQLNTNVIEDFEDGSIQFNSKWNDWNGNTPNLSIENNNPISGNASLKFKSNCAAPTVDINKKTGIKTDFIGFQFKVDNISPNGFDFTRIGIQSPGGRLIFEIELAPFNQEIKIDGSPISGYSANQVFDVELKNIDYSNNTLDLFLNGTDKGTFNFFGTANEFGKFSLRNDTADGCIKRNLFIDNIQTAPNKFGTTGDITFNNFSFSDAQGNSFSPSKVGIFPNQTLNGQSITYDLKDSSGTVVKTFNQSDLNQLQSVNTTDTTFQVEANFSGNGSQTPELEFLDVRGV